MAGVLRYDFGRCTGLEGRRERQAQGLPRGGAAFRTHAIAFSSRARARVHRRVHPGHFPTGISAQFHDPGDREVGARPTRPQYRVKISLDGALAVLEPTSPALVGVLALFELQLQPKALLEP